MDVGRGEERWSEGESQLHSTRVLSRCLLFKTHWRIRSEGRDLWLSHAMRFEKEARRGHEEYAIEILPERPYPWAHLTPPLPKSAFADRGLGRSSDIPYLLTKKHRHLLRKHTNSLSSYVKVQ
jgi:hypothetical protein